VIVNYSKQLMSAEFEQIQNAINDYISKDPESEIEENILLKLQFFI
jgi:hypothetical protein